MDGFGHDDWGEADGQVLVGTCPDMCPASERAMRERNGSLSTFEQLPENRRRTDASLAVKMYTRMPEMDPKLIRPLPVLQRTIAHLTSLLDRPYPPYLSIRERRHNAGKSADVCWGQAAPSSPSRSAPSSLVPMLSSSSGPSPSSVQGELEQLLSLHAFLWDRMRAVRVDLRMQRLTGVEVVRLYETIIRFHILASYELTQMAPTKSANRNRRAPSAHVFDVHLNLEQTVKACAELFSLYDHLRQSGSPRNQQTHSGLLSLDCDDSPDATESSGVAHPTEPEFRAYHLLLTASPSLGADSSDLVRKLAALDPKVLRSPEVAFARAVIRALRTDNPAAFFRLACEATYLQACIMHMAAPGVRTRALLAAYAATGKDQRLPLDVLQQWLRDNGEDVAGLVQHFGLSIAAEGGGWEDVQDGAGYGNLYVLKTGAKLEVPSEPLPVSRWRLADAKRSSTIVDDVGG